MLVHFDGGGFGGGGFGGGGFGDGGYSAHERCNDYYAYKSTTGSGGSGGSGGKNNGNGGDGFGFHKWFIFLAIIGFIVLLFRCCS